MRDVKAAQSLARHLGHDDENMHTDAVHLIEWMALYRMEDGRVPWHRDRGGHEVVPTTRGLKKTRLQQALHVVSESLLFQLFNPRY
jgi:hypothetical protein